MPRNVSLPKADHPWYGARGSARKPRYFSRKKSIHDFLLEEEITRLTMLEDVKTEFADDRLVGDPHRADPSFIRMDDGGYKRRPVHYD